MQRRYAGFLFFPVANYFGSVKFKFSRIIRSIVEMSRRRSKIETKRFARENKNKNEQKRAMCVINKTRHVARQSIYLYKQNARKLIGALSILLTSKTVSHLLEFSVPEMDK